MQLRHDAEAVRHELIGAGEERVRLEEKLAAAEAARGVAMEQLRQANTDLRELAREKKDLSAQHTEVLAQTQVSSRLYRVQLLHYLVKQ